MSSGAGAAASKTFRNSTMAPGSPLNLQQLRTVQFLTDKYEKEVDTQKRNGNSAGAAKAELRVAKMRQSYYGAGDKTAQESYKRQRIFFESGKPQRAGLPHINRG